MKQFSNKQRVCKNKTKRHNKRNKTRKGGAPTTNRNRYPTNRKYSPPPSRLSNTTTLKSGKKKIGTVVVRTDHGMKPSPFPQPPSEPNGYLERKAAKKEEENKKKSSLYGRISRFLNPITKKPHTNKKNSLLRYALYNSRKASGVNK